MALVSVLLRSALALVFLVAAVGKARDRRGTLVAALALGVPSVAAPAVVRTLPVVEALAAALLLAASTARLGAALAGLLLIAFTAVLARSLAAGRRPACHCFGQVGDEPIGASTVVRNLALLGAALLVVVEPGPAWGTWLTSSPSRLAGGLALLSLGLLVGAVGMAVLVVDVRSLRHRLDDVESSTPPLLGIAQGREAPDFQLPDLEGNRWGLGDLVGEAPLLVVFTDPNCGPCGALLPDLSEWSELFEQTFRLVVVSTGDPSANAAKFDQLGVQPVLLQRRIEVMSAYKVQGTPAAVLIGPDRRVLEPVASGVDDIQALVSRTAAARGAPPRPAGARAPAFHVHASDGTHIDNRSLAGSLSVVVFWDDTCSFCGAIAGELPAKVAAMVEAGVTAVVVAPAPSAIWEQTGAKLVVDADRQLVRTFGSPGTPSASMIDAEGRIAAPMATGREEAYALVERASAMMNAARAVAGQRPARHPSLG